MKEKGAPYSPPLASYGARERTHTAKSFDTSNQVLSLELAPRDYAHIVDRHPASNRAERCGDGDKSSLVDIHRAMSLLPLSHPLRLWRINRD
jgi:hypothetical protein